ncbi:sulfatase family protein [Rhodopirellula sallentina]|uniref:Heparan N-sulfatase n=1 Tax=Rhodopirellula sallentina SM41 TaxID=1263870 RepID=M5U6L7_9BACT|nr:sulfatase [Rhodopirellula sallentina]EMI57080.1 heparan N-sulfatase [Rhodopirellula sallentina SM41]
MCLFTRNRFGQTKPNIVFIIANDLGVRDTGFMGKADVRTPALDELALRSVLFDRVFVASPSCAPSRGALLSGLMPFRNGAEPNHTLVGDDVTELPSYMHDIGYEVASIGKITHGTDKRAGFDFDNRILSLENIDIVRKYLNNREYDKPLLLMVGIKDPHVPWPRKHFGHYDPLRLSLPARLVDTPETRIELARYYSAVERMDLQVAATLKAVDQHFGPGTIILFTSNHGAQLPYGKWNTYDGRLRVPLLVSWPTVPTLGTRNSSLLSFVDLLPTLIEMSGGDPPRAGYRENEINGRSFLPLLRGKSDHYRDHVSSTNSSAAHHTFPLRSVRAEQFPYIKNVYPELNFTVQTDHNPRAESHGMWKSWVRQAESDVDVAKKLRRYHCRSPDELYDVENNLYEQNNLVNDPDSMTTLESHR